MAGYSPMGGIGGFTTNGLYNYGTNVVVSSSTATTTVVWQAWNYEYQTALTQQQLTQYQLGQSQPHPNLAERNPDEDRRRAEDREERLRASHRARVLLLSCLSDEERRRYEERNMFFVRSSGANRYRLHHSRQPVRYNSDGIPITRYCIHTYGVPREDELLGFKLLLEANEPGFLNVANASPITITERMEEEQLAA